MKHNILGRLAGVSLLIAVTLMAAAKDGLAQDRPAKPQTHLVSFGLGRVETIDLAQSKISIAYHTDRETQYDIHPFSLTDITKVMVRKAVKVSDLKVGETLFVSGVPAVITSSQLNAGEEADEVFVPILRPFQPDDLRRLRHTQPGQEQWA